MIVPPCNRILGHAERQVNRTSHGSPFFARRGFSLIELLIVLAILTMITAFVLPALTGPLDRSRLRSAAVDVQSAWGKARSFAIREGMPMTFRCRLGGRHWKIERDGRKAEVSFDSDAAAAPSELRAESDQDNDQQAVGSQRKGNLVREGWLPEGITFADLTLHDISVQRLDEFGNQSADEQPLESAGPKWSGPLKFRPEGRSQDAELRIVGADHFVVEINIRGLTSAVSFTAPFRRRQAVVSSGGRP